MELSKLIRNHARSIQDKSQLILNSFARALEIIPRTLCENAGMDANEILNKLRYKHSKDENGKFFGVDIEGNDICNTNEKFIWEPLGLKLNYITAALETVQTILSIDHTINVEQDRENKKMKTALPGMGQKLK